MPSKDAATIDNRPRWRRPLAGSLISLLSLLIVILSCRWLDLLDGGEAAHGVGHKRPFGTSRHPALPVPESDGPAPPGVFYRDHVLPLRPLVMRSAVARTRAFRLWDDDYFLGLQLDPAASLVHVETTKKERRDQRTYDAPFQQFVRTYNSTGHYMVARLPTFLAPDFPLPWSLQCPDVAAALVEAIVWFSSGGTSSVVHTDAVDNLNCLIRGNKTFVLVDPAVHGHRVPIDHPEGAFSSIDVDSVDYRLYPGIGDVQYHVARLSPGDCLYIPYKWLHQVRSYGRNIAVNLWFDKALVRDTAGCQDAADAQWPVDSASFKGFDFRPPVDVFAEAVSELQAGGGGGGGGGSGGGEHDRPAAAPASSSSSPAGVEFAAALNFIVPEHAELKLRFGDRFVDELAAVFKAFDSNADSRLDLAEVTGQSAANLREIDRLFLRFDQTMKEMLSIVSKGRDREL